VVVSVALVLHVVDVLLVIELTRRSVLAVTDVIGFIAAQLVAIAGWPRSPVGLLSVDSVGIAFCRGKQFALKALP
jgi:hypothetical protein